MKNKTTDGQPYVAHIGGSSSHSRPDVDNNIANMRVSRVQRSHGGVDANYAAMIGWVSKAGKDALGWQF
jgi:hypothetical protein